MRARRETGPLGGASRGASSVASKDPDSYFENAKPGCLAFSKGDAGHTNRPARPAPQRERCSPMSIGANDPLAVLQRIRTSQPRGGGPGGAGRSVRTVLRADPLGAPAPGGPALADPALRVPRLLLALRVGRCGRRPLPERARALRGVHRLRVVAGRMGQPADPGQRRLLLPELRPGADRRLLSRAGRRDGVGAPPRRVERRGAGEPAARDDAARRGGLSRPGQATGPDRDRAECYIVPIDACYELVGHLRMLWRGFDGGTEANRKLDGFFAGVEEPGTVTDLRFEVARTPGPSRTRRCPTIMFRIRAEEADGRRVHAAALRCQIRIEPQRRRYSEPEEEKLYELFGETPQWGNSLRPFLWTHVSTTVGGFDGTGEFDLPVACTYDFEVAGAKYLHALGDGESHSSSCSREPCSPRGRPDSRRSRSRGRPRPPIVCRWRSGGPPWTPTSPAAAFIRLGPRHVGRPATVQGPPRAADLGPGPGAALQRGRGGATVTSTGATRTRSGT